MNLTEYTMKERKTNKINNNDIELRLKELEKRLYDHIIEDEVPVMTHEEFVEYSEWKRQRRQI